MGPAEHQGSRIARGAPAGLHVCVQCSSELVYPVDWEQAGAESWTVHLRCPNCEWRGSGTFSQELLDAFDEELDDGIQALLTALKSLARDNLSEDIDRFAAALAADAILPMDF